MSTTYLPCDNTLADCDPDVLVTQMQSERGTFSHDVSQQIQRSSQILKFGEKTKRPFPSGSSDVVKTMVLDIAQPSTRDVLDHQKRLAEGRSGNSPCDIPSKKIPYGSHTVEACLFGWAWETDWFCKTDLAFKYQREKQIGQVKQIMTTWAAKIWDCWYWRAYQRSVRNWVLNANLPSNHGASGYALQNPTSILTVAWLDLITTRLRDAAGLIGSPMAGSWCIFIGEEECKTLFDEYYKDGAQNFGLRQNHAMSEAKRYDATLEMEYYELKNYKFFVEARAPRFRDRVGTETWDDAMLDDISQVTATFGTESQVPKDYRNPDVAKYAECLIFNEEAVHWLTPPLGMTENNGFHQDREPGYSYAGDFIPVSPPQVQDPLGKKVKYYAEFVAGMESVFPDRGAAILSLAAHINPELKSISYTLSPTDAEEVMVSVKASVPILPTGTLQIQTDSQLPNVADGFRLFLRTAGDRVVKVADYSSSYCEDLGVWLHSLTFDNADAGVCVPRECDPWKEVVVLEESTSDSALLSEDGCELCGGATPTGSETTVLTVTYTGDNIAGIVVSGTTYEDTTASTLESTVQTALDGGDGGTLDITEGVAGNDYLWTITLTGSDATSFAVLAIEDGGGLVSFSSTGTTAAVTSATVFTVQDNGTNGSFATYAGAWYDSGENDGSGYPVYTNGTEFACNQDADWDGAVMSFYDTLAHAQADSNETYVSALSGIGPVYVTATTTDVGVQY